MLNGFITFCTDVKWVSTHYSNPIGTACLHYGAEKKSVLGKTEYHDGREVCAMGMWVSQVELCNQRFVTSDLYNTEWINGGLELLITSGRNNFLISSTEIVFTNEVYFTVFVNIKLTS